MIVGVRRLTATTRAVRSSSRRDAEGVPVGVVHPRGARPGEDLGDRAVAVLRGGHRLDDVAVVGGVVVAEERDELAALREAGEEGALVLGRRRDELPAVALRHGAVRREEAALLIERQRVRELLGVGDVGRGPRRDEQRARGQLDHLARAAAQEADGLELSELVGHGLVGLQRLDEGDALFERLDHFLVVQPIGRSLFHRASVRDRNAAPFPAEAREVRGLARRGGALALLADGQAVGEQPVEGVALLVIERGPHGGLGLVRAQLLVAVERLLGLDRVVGEQLRGRVDGRQAAADDDRGQLRLEVGEGLFLERARQLQGHQEVGGLAHAADDVVLDRDDRRAPGAGGDRDVVEAGLEGLLGRDGAAEAHAAEDREAAPAGERQVDERQEVLVPAHRDAVLGNAAEPGQGPLVEGPRELGVVADRADPGAVRARPVLRAAARSSARPRPRRRSPRSGGSGPACSRPGRGRRRGPCGRCTARDAGGAGCSGFQRVSRP